MYMPHDLNRQKILAFVYIPVVQKECDIFVKNWNSHRIKSQTIFISQLAPQITPFPFMKIMEKVMMVLKLV